MPPRNLLFIAITVVVSLACYSAASRNRYANLIAEAMDIVEQQALHEVPRKKLFISAMEGMLTDLDMHSRYISGDDYKAFDDEMRQEFGGVGMYVETDPRTKQLVVLTPLPGTPAFEAGINIGDQIIEIDGTPIAGLDRRNAVKLLKGPIGESVTLKIGRGGQELTKTLTRAAIAVSNVHGDYRETDGSWHFVLKDHPRIGYIRLSQFGERSASEIEDAIANIGSIDGLILDLRNNPGGLLNIAVEICDMFLPGNLIIVRTYGRNKSLLKSGEHVSTSSTQLDPDMPICILIDRNSASASEIVAGCLQDHGRAVLIGEQSWGKGTVQNVIPIQRNESALKLTTASYWRPSGKNIDRSDDVSQRTGVWGVQPDPGFEIELTPVQVFENISHRSIRDLEGLIRPTDHENTTTTSAAPSDSPPADRIPGPDDDEPNERDPENEGSEENPPGVPARPLESDSPHVDLPLKRAIDYIESLSRQR